MKIWIIAFVLFVHAHLAYSTQIAQGEMCNSATANQCTQGTACVEGNLFAITKPKWGGLKPKDIKKRIISSKDYYDSRLMPDIYNYKSPFTFKTISSIRRRTINKSKKSIKSKYPKYYIYKHESYGCDKDNDGRRDDTCFRNVWKKAKKFFGMPSVPSYKNQYAIESWGENKISRIEFSVGPQRTSIQIRNILGYYYHKKNSKSQSYHTLIDPTCTGDQSDIDNNRVEKCEQTYGIMDQIAEHLDSYRLFQKDSEYFKMPDYNRLINLGNVVKLIREVKTTPSANLCYSLHVDSQGYCTLPQKMCSCAPEGTKPLTIAGKKQACCQPDEEGTLPVIPNSNGVCSTGYIPSSPYGPGNHYQIFMKGDLEPSTSAPNSCDMVYRFNNVNRLRDLKLIDSSVAKSPNSGNNKELTIEGLRRYLNNDWMITLVVEFLFAQVRDACLKPNFKGKGGKPDGHKFSYYMRKKVGMPLQMARIQGDSSFKSMIQSGIDIEEELTKESPNRGDITILSLDAIIQKEKSMLGFENALLFGTPKQYQIGSSEKSSSAGIHVPLYYNSNTSWLDRMKDGYHDLKFSWWYARRPLKYSFWKRKPHKFKCEGMWWKEKAAKGWDQAYKIKGTWSWFSRDWFLDPPVPSSMDKPGKKSDFFCRRCRKASSSDIKKDLKKAIKKYFKGSISFDEDGNRNSFITFTDPDRILNMMSDYGYKIFKWYSKRKRKREHPVKSRMDTFYPRVETVLEELGYYFNQITAARAQKIECLESYRTALKTEVTKNGIHLSTPDPRNKAIHRAEIGQTEQEEIAIDEKEQDGKVIEFKKDMTDVLSGKINASNFDSSSTSSNGSSISSNSASDSYVSANVEYHQNAARRNEKRRIQHKNLKKAFSEKGYQRLVGAAAASRSDSPQHYNGVSASLGLNGSYKNGMEARKIDSYKQMQDRALKESSHQDYGQYDLPSGHSFLENIFDSSDDSSSDYDQYEEHQAVSNQADKMIKAIEKDQSKYNKNNNDTLFDIITKRYIRSGYHRLLMKKKGQ